MTNRILAAALSLLMLAGCATTPQLVLPVRADLGHPVLDVRSAVAAACLVVAREQPDRSGCPFTWASRLNPNEWMVGSPPLRPEVADVLCPPTIIIAADDGHFIKGMDCL